MHDAYKVPQVAVLLDDLVSASEPCQGQEAGKGKPTLVSDPFALFHRLGPRAERHEIAFDNVLYIMAINPEGKRPRQVVRVDDVVPGGNGATRFVHADGLGQRRRAGQGGNSGSEVCGSLVCLRGIVRESCLTCSRGGRALWLTRRFVGTTPETSVARKVYA